MSSSLILYLSAIRRSMIMTSFKHFIILDCTLITIKENPFNITDGTLQK